MILDGLESERLKYRSITMDDYKPLLAFFSNPEATKFFYPTQPPEELCREWIKRQLQRYKNDGYGLCALIEKTTGQLVGQCGLLNQVVDDIKELEIGYSLIPAFWSQGFAIESARFFKDFAFENQMAPSIISIIEINNLNSQKVASKNGMQIQKKTRFKNMEAYVFRITFSQWRENLKEESNL